MSYVPATNITFTQNSAATTDIVFGGEYLSVVFEITGLATVAGPGVSSAGSLNFARINTITGSFASNQLSISASGLLDASILEETAADITFEYQVTSSSNINFGVPRTDIQLISGTSATIQQFNVTGVGSIGLAVSLSGSFAISVPAIAVGLISYNSNVPRGPGLNVGTGYQKPQSKLATFDSVTMRNVHIATNQALQHKPSSNATLDNALVSRQGVAVAKVVRQAHCKGNGVAAHLRAIYANAKPIPMLTSYSWGSGHCLALNEALVTKQVTSRWNNAANNYSKGRLCPVDLAGQTSMVYKRYAAITLVWSYGKQRAGKSKAVVIVPVAPNAYGTTDIVFSCEQRGSDIIFRASPCKRFKSRRSYYLKHDIEIKLLSDNTILPVTGGVTMGITSDEYAWSFSANMAGKDAWDYLDITDNPVFISVKLATNSVETAEWHFVIEDLSHNESFGKRSISTKGRSRTVLLSDRYIPPTNYTASEVSANQLADLVLPFGGGWTSEWDYAETWPIPTNAFNYQNQAPIGAIAQIANSIGGMVVPDKKDKKLTIAPRYKYMPWDYAGMQNAIEIPQEAILSIDYRLTPKPQANGVYVRGPDNGGILAWVKRDGTDGATLASDFQSQLICHEYGARYAGERILADKHTPSAIKSFTIPLGGIDFPLLNVGDLVDVGNQHIRGTVTGVNISASDKGVRQTISLGNDNNSWVQFQKLLPKYPLVVGEVVAVLDNNSLLVAFSSGSAIVRGTEPLGAKVYVRNGKTEGLAPNLSSMEIVV